MVLGLLMPRIVNGQLLQRSVVRPLGAESRFEAVTMSLAAGTTQDFVWTPTLGDIILLERVWIDGSPFNSADDRNNVTFEIYAMNRKPESVADARSGTRVLPIRFKDILTRNGLSGPNWHLQYDVGKWYEIPTLRFAFWASGNPAGTINLQVGFQYQVSEV